MPEIISAGLLMYFKNKDELKVFLVHPGGPFFKKKDLGYWGIPKGLPNDFEDLLDAAKREFFEETGKEAHGKFIPLGTVIQKGGKKIHCWAFRGESDEQFDVKCNTFEIEWPPGSGKKQSFPEIDRGEFFIIDEARKKINPAQEEFINRLLEHLNK
jgi:predicted NUDIX family NTP pyrophosphohydrolase